MKKFVFPGLKHLAFILILLGLLVAPIFAQDSLNVSLVGHVSPGYGGWTTNVFVSGSYAYLANWNNGLRIIDISDPYHPSEVGFYDTYDTGGSVMDVFVSGSYAYLADCYSLRIIRISDPEHPSEVGSWDIHPSVEHVFVSGDYAYIADAIFEELRVIDVSDPRHPVEVGSEGMSTILDIFVSGDYAYVVDRDFLDAFRVIAWIPLSPGEISEYIIRRDPSDRKMGIFVSGDYAYVADGDDGLDIIDISDPWPEDPEDELDRVGFCSLEGGADAVFVSGTCAYVLNRDGLRVIDVTSPYFPLEVGFYSNSDLSSNREGVFVSGGYAYVACGGHGLYILDVSHFTGIDRCSPVPSIFSLNSIPNPFNSVVSINYSIPTTSDISMDIYDIMGHKVCNLINQDNKPAGRYTVQWQAPEDIPSGLYFIRMKAGNQKVVRKMTLIR